MDVKGEYLIAGSREQVWSALIDPEVLKVCIPGRESLEEFSDAGFEAKVTAAIGPVKARFNTSLNLENVKAPESYTVVGSSRGGAAGFGRGNFSRRRDPMHKVLNRTGTGPPSRRPGLQLPLCLWHC